MQEFIHFLGPALRGTLLQPLVHRLRSRLSRSQPNVKLTRLQQPFLGRPQIALPTWQAHVATTRGRKVHLTINPDSTFSVNV